MEYKKSDLTAQYDFFFIFFPFMTSFEIALDFLTIQIALDFLTIQSDLVFYHGIQEI